MESNAFAGVGAATLWVIVMHDGGFACLLDMFLVWIYAVVMSSQAIAESGGLCHEK